MRLRRSENSQLVMGSSGVFADTVLCAKNSRMVGECWVVVVSLMAGQGAGDTNFGDQVSPVFPAKVVPGRKFTLHVAQFQKCHWL